MMRYSKPELEISVILPTYNEAENVAPLVRALSKSLQESFVDSAKKKNQALVYELLFVDDSANERTADAIRKMAITYPEIRLIRRSAIERTGLATAFVAGFREARGKYILCMDTDLQHPPEVAPHLVRAIQEGERDLIVASRYIKGGGADGLGTAYRKLVSRVSRWAAWLVLPVTRKTTDPGSGFFVVTKELVDSIPFHGLRGFKILIDILARAPLARVGEVPYVFRKRENEQSKATFRQGIEFLRHVLYLRNDEDIYNPKALPSASAPHTRAARLSGWIPEDLVALAVIAGVGWFLVGYFADYEYLISSYEDWIYHAFRVETLARDGIASWNHEWGTGMNIWRLYQYGQHHLVLWLTMLTGLSIPKALIYLGISIYLGLRLISYLILRAFGISPLFALLGVMTSYTFAQEWIAMQDFSIYVAFASVPLYIFLWAKAFETRRLAYFLAAFTGCLWSLHPIMGFSMSLLLGFLVLFSPLKNQGKSLFMMSLAYLAGATPFLAQYFMAGYFFTNPLFKSPIYLSFSVLPVYGGLSLMYWVLFVLSWILLLFQSHRIATWAKALLVYCSFYLILIYLGQNYFLPEFLVQFQFSRGISAIALILAFCFGAILHQSFRRLRSNVISGLALALIAINMVHAVDIASGYYVPAPGNSIDNPVARFFETRPEPRGSVYYDNVSEASYFTRPKVRFVTSYNEHLQPHPYSTRLNILVKNSTIFTGISNANIRSLEDYATVLGIEYYFLQGKSPFVKGLTEKENAVFEKVDEIQSETLSDSVAVVRRTQPTQLAYVGERQDLPRNLLENELDQPTLSVATYQPWDEAISQMAHALRSERWQPLELSFHETDRLALQLPPGVLAQYTDPVVLIQQSYDQNWRVMNVDGVMIAPTALRTMTLNIPKSSSLKGDIVWLQNSWPRWHWPVQTVGLAALVTTAMFWFFGKRRTQRV